MIRWEYKVEWLITNDDFKEGETLAGQLAALGDEGWELVCVMPRAYGTERAIFKRPKQ